MASALNREPQGAGRTGAGFAENTRRITDRELLMLGPAKAEAKEAAPAPRNDNTTVIIVRGAKSEEYSVKNGH